MNNEHLEDKAEFPGNADDGPLDPSVFFGLFDDLDGTTPTSDGDAANIVDEASDDVSIDVNQTTDSNQTSSDPEHPDPEDPDLSAGADHGFDSTDLIPAADSNGGTAAADHHPQMHTGQFPGAPSQAESDPSSAARSNGSNLNGTSTNTVGVVTTPAPNQQTQLQQPANPGRQAQPTEPLQAPVVSPPVVTMHQVAPAKPQAPIILPVQTERSGGTLAKAALITIAGGLFAGLVVAFVVSLSRPETASAADGAFEETSVVESDPAASTVVQILSLTNVGTMIEQGSVTSDELAQLFNDEMSRSVRESRLDLTGLMFEAGTTNLSTSSQVLVAELGAVLADSPDAPVSATIRTYTERTAAANLELSRQQAQSLIEALEAAGAAPGQVRALGLGAPPLSQAQPVPDFVIVTPGFGSNFASGAFTDRPTFMFGNDLSDGGIQSWPLRIEAMVPMMEIGQSLQAGTNVQVGLAGYSFFAESTQRNRAIATATADTVAGVLAAGFEISEEDLSIVAPGPAPFVPSAEVGNVIWLAAGPESAAAYGVAGVDVGSIDFTGDSLKATSNPVIEALAAVLSETGATIMVDVRTHDGGGDSANNRLSGARAAAIAAALNDAGVSAEQVRTTASGASSYFASDGPLVTITALP